MRRPLYLLLVFASLIALVATLSCQSKSVKSTGEEPVSADQATEAVSSSALKKVTFIFEPDQQYSEVYVAGTFNGWSADTTPMKLTGDHYEATLFLAKGEHR